MSGLRRDAAGGKRVEVRLQDATGRPAAAISNRHRMESTVYNNHYFIDPNNRRIITHKVRDGKTLIFQIQDFVRVQQP